jgi:carbamoyltransferase
MNILGISDHYIGGASVVIDGKLVAAVNEERLARKKMVLGFPWKSVEAVLKLAGLGPGDVDYVAVASRWGHFLPKYVDFSSGVFGVDEGIVKNAFFSLGSGLSFLRSKLPFLETLYYQLRQPTYAYRRNAIRRVLRNEYDIHAPVDFVWHHYAHAAAAYYGSGFEDALVVTLDGSGDGHSSHVYDVTMGDWRRLHAVPSFDGLGNYYGYVTQLCGFTAGKHEGKITGLAAYGEDIYQEVLGRFIQCVDGTMVNIGNAFRGSALQKLRKALPPDFRREDLAASVQNLSEDVCTSYVKYWQKRTGKRNVALAGGVVANVKINQRIHAGAALAVTAKRQPELPLAGRSCFEHVYLGPEFSDKEIEEALRREDLEFSKPEQMHKTVAELIKNGYVIARFNGRMEYGPRALGNRSILYRPDDKSVNDWLNQRLGRTEFMPFAPATLAEHENSHYLGVNGASNTARFMTITFDCTKRMQKTCAGVVHIDGTARPQLVSEKDNPSYYRIIEEFNRLTGIPSIVNTSFNIHEEPIVCTPGDAIRAYQQGHLDVLAIGPFIVKNPQAEERIRASDRSV